MDRPAQVERVYSISGGDLKPKRRWMAETKEVEDLTFVKIAKFDRGFVAFCTGKSLQLEASKDQWCL